MAKNVTTDQTRLLFITTARGNADTALPRGRRSVRRAIRLVHEKVSTCRIGRTGASRFGTEGRTEKGCTARRRRVSREFLCVCVGWRASTDAVLPRVHRSVGPGSGSLNVYADVQGAGSWMDTLRHTIRCKKQAKHGVGVVSRGWLDGAQPSAAAQTPKRGALDASGQSIT